MNVFAFVCNSCGNVWLRDRRDITAATPCPLCSTVGSLSLRGLMFLAFERREDVS
jgi:hypothetical protein